MMYKALVSFSGKLSMAMGEVREISDQSLADDLLRAGYVAPLEAEKKPKEEKATEEKAEKPNPRRKGNKNGN